MTFAPARAPVGACVAPGASPLRDLQTRLPFPDCDLGGARRLRGSAGTAERPGARAPRTKRRLPLLPRAPGRAARRALRTARLALPGPLATLTALVCSVRTRVPSGRCMSTMTSETQGHRLPAEWRGGAPRDPRTSAGRGVPWPRRSPRDASCVWRSPARRALLRGHDGRFERDGQMSSRLGALPSLTCLSPPHPPTPR